MAITNRTIGILLRETNQKYENDDVEQFQFSIGGSF